jgi:hypothetical protein
MATNVESGNAWPQPLLHEMPQPFTRDYCNLINLLFFLIVMISMIVIVIIYIYIEICDQGFVLNISNDCHYNIIVVYSSGICDQGLDHWIL